MTKFEPTQLSLPSDTLDALATATALQEAAHQSPVPMTEPIASRPAREVPARPWLHRALTTAMLASFALAGWFFTTSPTTSTTFASVSKPTGKAAAVTVKPERRYVTKNIEDIRAGDYVLAREEHGTKLAYCQVAETYRRTSHHLRHLTFEAEDGSKQNIQTTDEHPFWHAKKNIWLEAGHFKIGDVVETTDRRLQTLTATHRTEHPEGVPVFNFQVESAHTYFVARNSESSPVLVHNADGYDFKSMEQMWASQKIPKQVTPTGTTQVFEVIKPSSKLGVDPYVKAAEYDNFGRLKSITDHTAHGMPNVHPNPHHHLFDFFGGKVKIDGSAVIPGTP